MNLHDAIKRLQATPRYLDANFIECAPEDAVWTERGNIRSSKTEPPRFLVGTEWLPKAKIDAMVPTQQLAQANEAKQEVLSLLR